MAMATTLPFRKMPTPLYPFLGMLNQCYGKNSASRSSTDAQLFVVVDTTQKTKQQQRCICMMHTYVSGSSGDYYAFTCLSKQEIPDCVIMKPRDETRLDHHLVNSIQLSGCRRRRRVTSMVKDDAGREVTITPSPPLGLYYVYLDISFRWYVGFGWTQ